MRFLIWVVLLLASLAVFAQSEQYNFTRLNTQDGLSHNRVNAILKDTEGFLWFGTLSGLNRYDGYSIKIFNKKHNDSTSLLDNYVQSLYELPDGKMWVTTQGGPCIYNSHTQKFDADVNNYLRSLGLPSGTINNIIKGNNGRYWFLYNDNDLYLYAEADKTAKPFRLHHTSQPAEKIVSVKETKDGKLWLVYQ